MARGRGHRQVTLLAGRGTEIHAGRHVDHQPGLQLPIGDHLADMRMGGACRDRPVHPAHVVAGLVNRDSPGSEPGPGISPR